MIKAMREGERKGLRKQFDYEMVHILKPMTKKFRSKPRTFKETEKFFRQVEEMFREWTKEYLVQRLSG